MRTILQLLFFAITMLLFGAIAYGQNASPILGSGTNLQINYNKGGGADDSMTAIPVRRGYIGAADTLYKNYRMKGRIRVDYDSSRFYYHDGTNDVRVLDTKDTVNLLATSNRVNQKVGYNDTAGMLNAYRRKSDSTAGGYYPYSTNPKGYLQSEVDGSVTNELQTLSLTADDSLHISSGNVVKLPYIHLLTAFTGDTLRSFGDSYETSTGASVVDSGYSPRLAVDLGIPKVSYGGGGQGIRYSALQAYNLRPRGRGLKVINCGLNDAYYSTVYSYNLQTLYDYWSNYENLFLVSCFEDTVSSVQSSYFTKSGTLTTTNLSSSRSVSLGSTVTRMNVAGDYVEFATADSGFTIHYFKSTRTKYGSIIVSTVSPSVLPIDTLNPQEGAWATDLYSSDTIFPAAQYYSLKGYGSGSKTIRLTATAGGGATEWWIDAVGFPKTDANKRGVVFMEAPQIPGAATNYGDPLRIFTVNSAMRNNIAKNWQGFPIRITRQPLNLQSDFNDDGVHPNNQGHRKYDSAFYAEITKAVSDNIKYIDFNPSGAAVTAGALTQTTGNPSVSVTNNLLTVNIPNATALTPGLLAFAPQSFPGGEKTFTDNVSFGLLTTIGTIPFITTGQGRIGGASSNFSWNNTNKTLALSTSLSNPLLTLTNSLSSSGPSIALTANTVQNNSTIARLGTTVATYKTIRANDLEIYSFGNTGHNIAIFNDDPNGTIGFTTGGLSTHAMFIDKTGKVGIGDTTPVSALTVGSGDLFQVNSSGQIVKYDNATPASGQILVGNGTKLALKTIAGSATKSGDGATTTFTIAHGLGSTPVYFNVVPKNAASAGISYMTADGTNITIVYTVAPASGTNNLSYTFIAIP